MRVAVDLRLQHYAPGGIARYMTEIAARLPQQAPANHYLLLHARKAAPPPKTATVTPIACWTPSHHRWERLALSMELCPRRPDVLHCPDFIVPRGGNWRAVSTVHDLAFLEEPQWLDSESRRYYNDQIQASCDRADAIITVSHATRAALLHYLRVDDSKITVIHSGVAKHFAPPPASALARFRARLALPDSYLLFVGTFEPRKNLSSLLQGYAIFCGQHRDVPHLILAGHVGAQLMALRQQAARLGIARLVRFLPNFPAADLPLLYSGATLFLLLSHTEGFGLPVLEAMSCGTPVLLSRRGALPEVGGNLAHYCEPYPESIAHALQRALADRDSLRKRGWAGRGWAGKFTWERTVAQTLRVYHG